MGLRIGQYLGACPWGPLTPDALGKGLGGRETALIQLSRAWATDGHEVVNFVPLGDAKPWHAEWGKGKEDYIPGEMVRSYCEAFGFDAMVSWEEPRIFGVPEIRQGSKITVLEMQVAHTSVTSPDGSINLDEEIDRYHVLSQWAGDFLCKNDRNIDPLKIHVYPNGVHLPNYDAKPVGHPGPGPYKFLYASSPDRGLDHLLHAWPKIRKAYPGSTLDVCYGIENFILNNRLSHFVQSEMAMDVAERIDQAGVHYRGKVGQDQLAKLHYESHALLYPADTLQPTETGCITIVEAMASGSPVITTDCDCIGPDYGDSSAQLKLVDYTDDAYAALVSSVMDNPKTYEDLQERGLALAQRRDWDLIGGSWTLDLRTELLRREALATA